jgi:hypothetical protein
LLFLFLSYVIYSFIDVLSVIKTLSCWIYVQKLEKVQLGLQEEERNRNDLKDRYAAAIGEQKRCYSLMKAFQVCFFQFIIWLPWC